MSEPVFELHGAGLRYGALRALDGVDLTIRAGERVALVGPSGAGKSSLISLLNGTVAPTEGTVRVLGRDVAALSPRELRRVQRRIGTVYQQFHLVGPLRVVHNVNAGRLGRWPLWRAAASLVAARDTQAAAAALARVGIADRLHERTDQLSGGEQQRVAIARVLVQQPLAVLADEPVASLDPARGREVLDLLADVGAGANLVSDAHLAALALQHDGRVISYDSDFGRFRGVRWQPPTTGS